MTSRTTSSEKKLWAAGLAWFYPILFFVFAIVIWHISVRWSGIPKFILPSPIDVAEALSENWPRLRVAAIRTTLEAAAGLATSLVAGFLLASVLSQAKWLRQSLLPYTLIFQTVPIIGVAPLVITWFGNTLTSVVLIASFISIFPIISNTTNGMISLDKDQRDLFQLNGASRWQRYLFLQIPASMPLFSAGLQIAAAASVLGACVGDFFVGSAQQEGLGFLIFQAKDRDASLMFATLILLTIIGLTFYAIATLIGRHWLLKWQR